MINCTGPEGSIGARSIILRSIAAGENRADETRFLLVAPGLATLSHPPASVQPLPGHPAELIPMCAASRFVPTDTKIRPDHAYWAADEAQHLLTARALGTSGLLALDACFNASPFAGWCGGALKRARRSARAGIAEEAIRLGAARRENGRACWCELGPCSWEDRPRSGGR